MGLREFKPTHFGAVLQGDSDVVQEAGGSVQVWRALVALNIGDGVFFTATAGQVTKNTTVTAGHRLGIVVGGEQTAMMAVMDPTAVGQPAAGVSEMVLVQVDGVAYGIAQPADVAVGETLLLDTTTAGRLLDGITVGSILGQALEASTAAGQTIKVLLGRR